MGKHYTLPQTLFTARGTKRVMGVGAVPGGFLLALECGHTVTIQGGAAPKRAACPTCAAVFRQPRNYQTKGK